MEFLSFQLVHLIIHVTNQKFLIIFNHFSFLMFSYLVGKASLSHVFSLQLYRLFLALSLYFELSSLSSIKSCLEFCYKNIILKIIFEGINIGMILWLFMDKHAKILIFMVIFLGCLFPKTLCIKAVSDLQHHWDGGTEIFHLSSALTYA